MGIKIAKLRIVVALIVMLSVTTLVAQVAKLDTSLVQSRLDTYIKPYFEQRDFNGVVLIAHGDKEIAKGTIGFIDERSKKPINIDTKFRIASLTKAFTAASIIILSDRGKLKLDDPVSRFYPNFPNGENIKIEHLLLHQSGVGGLDDEKHARVCYEADRLVEEIGRVKPQFPPGTAGRYSNSGYNILAAIIEKASGESYEQFLQKNIFKPLKMNDSGSFCSEPATLSNLAKGHATGSRVGSIELVSPSEMAQMGSGSVYSTAPDLIKWLRSLKANVLFDLDRLRYPYGWGKRDYSGSKLIEQSGIVEGFNAYMARYPTEELYFVFLSNVQSGLFNRVPRDFRAVVLGGEFTKPQALTSIDTSKVDLTQYSGEYRTPNISVPLIVTVQNGGLYLKWGTGGYFRSLTAVSKDKFFHRSEYADIAFERDSQGKIEKIVWGSGSDPMVLTRSSTTP